MKRVTIAELASGLGLSKAAVSYAFNEPRRLSPRTVTRVMKAAEKLGYSPNPIARSMNSRRVGTIGILIPQDISTALENPYYTEFMRGVGRVCLEENLSLTLVPPLRGSLLNSLNHSAVDGFLIMGLEPDRSEVQMLRRRAIPFVLVDTSESDGISVVSVDDRAGAAAAMKHLLDLGHRRVSIVAIESGHGGKFGHYTGVLRERMQGYGDALAKRGMRPGHGSVRVIEAESSREGGRRAFDKLLAGRWRPTGVAVMSDIQAFGILDGARSKGIDVPSELSVVGYDDIPEAEHANPPLSTVRQPIIEKAEAAANLLVRAISDGPPAKGVRSVLKPVLVIRKSSAAPSRDSAKA